MFGKKKASPDQISWLKSPATTGQKSAEIHEKKFDNLRVGSDPTSWILYYKGIPNIAGTKKRQKAFGCSQNCRWKLLSNRKPTFQRNPDTARQRDDCHHGHHVGPQPKLEVPRFCWPKRCWLTGDFKLFIGRIKDCKFEKYSHCNSMCICFAMWFAVFSCCAAFGFEALVVFIIPPHNVPCGASWPRRGAVLLASPLDSQKNPSVTSWGWDVPDRFTNGFFS